MRKLGWWFAAVAWTIMLLDGCAQAPDPSTPRKLATVAVGGDGYTLVRFHDNQYGVVCYMVKTRNYDREGLSCLPYGALRPGADRE